MTETNASGQGASDAMQTPEASAKVRYRVIDLGTENAIANDIQCNQIVGSKDFAEGRHAAFWPNLHGEAIDLGTLPGDTASRGFGINSYGQMVGYDYPADFSALRPVFWADPQSGPVDSPACQ